MTFLQLASERPILLEYGSIGMEIVNWLVDT